MPLRRKAEHVIFYDRISFKISIFINLVTFEGGKPNSVILRQINRNFDNQYFVKRFLLA